jgi:hypothetical protein
MSEEGFQVFLSGLKDTSKAAYMKTLEDYWNFCDEGGLKTQF